MPFLKYLTFLTSFRTPFQLRRFTTLKKNIMSICSCLYSKIQEFSFLYLLLRIFKIFRQLIFFGQVRFRKKYKLLTHLCKNKDQTVLLNSFYYRALQLKFYYEEKHVYYEAKSRNLSLLHHTHKMHPKHKFCMLLNIISLCLIRWPPIGCKSSGNGNVVMV